MQIGIICKKVTGVVVPDIIKPVITTTSATLTVDTGTTVDKSYQIANNGLKVVDNVDGDITATTQVVTSSIDTATAGAKTQTITATDKAGNVATKNITVTVNEVIIPDTTKPVITTTATTLTVDTGTTVDKQYQIDNNGLSVVDDVDGDITASAKVTVSTIDTATAGTLTQTITATDTANNTQTKDITVTVEVPPALEQATKKGK
jgi:DnaJ-class molecular chaperone